MAIQNPPREYADLRWTYISLASNWLDRSLTDQVGLQVPIFAFAYHFDASHSKPSAHPKEIVPLSTIAPHLQVSYLLPHQNASLSHLSGPSPDNLEDVSVL